MHIIIKFSLSKNNINIIYISIFVDNIYNILCVSSSNIIVIKKDFVNPLKIRKLFSTCIRHKPARTT